MKRIIYIFIILLVICGVILIYNKCKNNKILLISDIANNCKYSELFITKNIKSLTNDIINNKTIWQGKNELFLKKSLRENDFIIINVGINEFASNYNKNNMSINYNIFRKIYNEIEKMIIEMKKYAKSSKIIFLGYYNPTDYYDSKTDEFFYYMDMKLNELFKNNNIIFIDLYELVKGNQYKLNNSYYLNNDAYKKITSIIDFYINTQ